MPIHLDSALVLVWLLCRYKLFVYLQIVYLGNFFEKIFLFLYELFTCNMYNFDNRYYTLCIIYIYIYIYKLINKYKNQHNENGLDFDVYRLEQV